jgi:predicted SprT family Zn-dependent metalloprotease
MVKTETEAMYSTIQAAFDFFNQTLFRGELPYPIFTLQRKNKAAGYYSQRRFKEIGGDRYVDEIALNPNHFVAHGEMENMQTLVHEMCHMWQFLFGKPSRRSYHNREFAEKMRSVGLMPSSTGAVGGDQVGQNMSDYPIEGGVFIQAFESWQETGESIRWASLEAFMESGEAVNPTGQPGGEIKSDGKKARNKKNKYKFECDSCNQRAWAKESALLICGICQEPMELVP